MVDFDLNDLADIPVPLTDHLEKIEPQHKKKGKSKYEAMYGAFCKWSGLPTRVRDPKTATAFEKKYHLPKGATENFKTRADFQKKRLESFWNWMIDNLPDVVASQLDLAIEKKNTAAAKFFAELIAPKLDIHKPKATIQPFFLVGVDQKQINKLFDTDMKGTELLPDDTIPDAEVVEEEKEEEEGGEDE